MNTKITIDFVSLMNLSHVSEKFLTKSAQYKLLLWLFAYKFNSTKTPIPRFPMFPELDDMVCSFLGLTKEKGGK